MSDLTGRSIGYWLFYTQRCVAYAFTEVLRGFCLERGKPYVITPSQWGALSLLDEECEGLTIGTISQKRGIDAPTVTGIIKRLEQSGLVERLQDRQDRRIVKVYLTGEAKEILPALSEVIAAFNASVLRNFSPEEQQDFLAKLQQLVGNVSAIAPNMGDRFGLLPAHTVYPSPFAEHPY